MADENIGNAKHDEVPGTSQGPSATRIPYGMIKLVEFKDISKDELIDIPHCARLQYRLMLHDAIIKAKVEFVKRRITVIYNPPNADNKKEKISREEIIDMLKKEGIEVSNNNITERDYDYVKEFYSYAFFPPEIRHSVPYGWSREGYAKMLEKRSKKQGAKKSILIFGK